MLTLKYDDLIDSSTLTSKIFAEKQEEIKLVETKLERLKAFDTTITNYLQSHGEMSYELYSLACVMFDYSDKTVSEIFEEIRKRG